MTKRPLKPCNHPRCPELTNHGYCEKHQPTIRRYDQERGSAAERGYDSRWRKARKAYLMVHPLCKGCEKNGRIIPATVVDHITPHRGNKELFWDKKNWQPLCKPCHDKKTATEDGGFGNLQG